VIIEKKKGRPRYPKLTIVPTEGHFLRGGRQKKEGEDWKGDRAATEEEPILLSKKVDNFVTGGVVD